MVASGGFRWRVPFSAARPRHQIHTPGDAQQGDVVPGLAGEEAPADARDEALDDACVGRGIAGAEQAVRELVELLDVPVTVDVRIARAGEASRGDRLPGRRRDGALEVLRALRPDC